MSNRIGIVAQNHGDVFGVHEDYMAFVEEHGTPVPIFPAGELQAFLATYKLDALLLPGGADVASNRYSWFPHIYSGNPNAYLEHFDTQILPGLIGRMPIFGICRGLQTLNVVLGGTLRQHLWSHPYSKNKTDAVHEIKTRTTENFKVNSFHHQAIGKLGRNLQIEATSLDGVVEAISDRNQKIFAVQWHPERLLDNYSAQAFAEILA